jgi:transcriptional regulator with XRE-family HTH domain
MNPADLGRRLIRLRRSQGLVSQRQGARHLGLKVHTLGRWERGLGYPTPPYFEILRRGYRCSLDFLFHGETAGMPEETLRLLEQLDEQDQAAAAWRPCCGGECRYP